MLFTVSLTSFPLAVAIAPGMHLYHIFRFESLELHPLRICQARKWCNQVQCLSVHLVAQYLKEFFQLIGFNLHRIHFQCIQNFRY